MSAHQMTPRDQALIKQIAGNEICVDCGNRGPTWASVSFGTLICLECSGTHRSLGVHISFVRSVTMDSWSDQQIACMKAGGNDKLRSYLKVHNLQHLDIKSKYEHVKLQEYKNEIRVQCGLAPQKIATPNNNNTLQSNNSSMRSISSSSHLQQQQQSGDPNGMERLPGESEVEYVARQTRLREEARQRMAAKFGSSSLSSAGGGGGASRMTGIGSNPNYRPYENSYGGVSVDGITKGFSSMWGSVSNTVTSTASAVTATASNAYNDPNLATNVQQTAEGAKAASYMVWGNLRAVAQTVAKKITEPDDPDQDGLGGLRTMAAQNRTDKYAGVGSNNVNQNGSSSSMNGPASYSTGYGGQNNSMNQANATTTSTTNFAPAHVNSHILGKSSNNDDDWDDFLASTQQQQQASMSQASSTNAGTMIGMSSSSYNNSNNHLDQKPIRSGSTGSLQASVGVSSNKNHQPTTSSSASPVKKLESSDDFFASFGA